MSRGARVALGVAMLVIAALFAALPWMLAVPGLGSWRLSLGLAGLPLLIAIPCLVASLRPAGIRLLAALVLLGCLAYVGSEIAAVRSLDDFINQGRRGPTSLPKSLLALVTFGGPAAYVTWTGRYPGWGRHAAAFAAPEAER